MVLAHTLGLYLITGAKVKTDRRDAYSLAKLLLVGAVPQAYIYPVETRPVRDLLRRRARLVQVRAGEYGASDDCCCAYSYKATNLDNTLRVTHPLNTYHPVNHKKRFGFSAIPLLMVTFAASKREPLW